MANDFIPYGTDPGTVGRRSATVLGPTETRGGVPAQFHRDEVVVWDRRTVTYKGAVGTFRTPGRAGTAGQKLFAIHNAQGSSVLVDVKSLNVTLHDTAAKVVVPPLIRAWRFTVAPTSGTLLTKRGPDTSLVSSASVVLRGDALSDGTVSGSALAVTLPAAQFIAQVPATRSLTLAGVEPWRERGLLQYAGTQTLRAPDEGIAVFLDYTVATSNPVTDMWTVDVVWEEYTIS